MSVRPAGRLNERSAFDNHTPSSIILNEKS